MANIDYPAAFPWIDPKTGIGEGGMSLRDWFAGQALASMVRDYETTGAMIDGDTAEEVACDAYVVADAMLKAREA